MPYTLIRAGLIATALIFAAPVSAQIAPARTEVIQFEAGTSAKTIKGTVKGYEVVDYVVSARAGQTMTVTLKSDKASNYFNVTSKGDDSAIYNGSLDGNSYTGVLPKDGDYIIRVYMMRNDARRNKTASYTLTTAIQS
jgi:hypothetical protein